MKICALSRYQYLLFVGLLLLFTEQAAVSQVKPDSSPRRSEMNLVPMPSQYAAAAVQSWTPLPSLSGSTLVFTALTKDQFGYQNLFLVRKRIGDGPLVDEGFKSYGFPTAGATSGIDISPDGRYTLVKSGVLQEPNANLTLFLWHLSAPGLKVTQGPLEYAYFSSTSWSPNGRYLLFTGGTVEFGIGLGPNVLSAPIIYDLQTHTSRSVPSQASYGTSWTRQNMLFSLRPYQAKELKKDVTDTFLIERNHTSLYETPRQGGRSGLVMQNVSSPFAESPDGRWIAFQGWPEPTTEERATNNKISIENQSTSPKLTVLDSMALFLYDRVDKKRYRVAGEAEFGNADLRRYPITDLYWTPDSRNLLVVRNDALYKVSMPGRAFSLLLEEPIVEEQRNGRVESLGIKMMGFALGGALMMASRTVGELTSIQAINVATGEISTVAVIKNAPGVDWIETIPIVRPAILKLAPSKSHVSQRSKAMPSAPKKIRQKAAKPSN